MFTHSSSLNFCRSKENKHLQNLSCHNEDGGKRKWISNFECIEEKGRHRKFVEDICMDHEISPLSNTKMPKIKLIAKLMDTCFKNNP
jgi:hypothetical protein